MRSAGYGIEGSQEMDKAKLFNGKKAGKIENGPDGENGGICLNYLTLDRI